MPREAVNLTARERKELERLAKAMRFRCVAGQWRDRNGVGIDLERTYRLHRLLRAGVSLRDALGETLPRGEA
jgi:hypothetical protein